MNEERAKAQEEEIALAGRGVRRKAAGALITEVSPLRAYLNVVSYQREGDFRLWGHTAQSQREEGNKRWTIVGWISL